MTHRHIPLRTKPITFVSVVFLVRASGRRFVHAVNFMRIADCPALWWLRKTKQAEQDSRPFCGLVRSGEVKIEGPHARWVERGAEEGAVVSEPGNQLRQDLWNRNLG